MEALTLVDIIKKVNSIKEIQLRRISEGSSDTDVGVVLALDVREAEYLFDLIKEKNNGSCN